AVSVLMAYQLSPVYAGAALGRETLSAAGVYGLMFVLVASGVGLYEAGPWPSRTALFIRCATAAVFAAALTLIFFYLVFYRPIGRWVLAGAVGLTTLLVFVPREGLRGILTHRPRRILFVGRSMLTARIIAGLKSKPHYMVVGAWPP